MSGNESSTCKQLTAAKSQIHMKYWIIENWDLLDNASYSDWQEMPQLLYCLPNLERCIREWHTVGMKHWNCKKVVLHYFSCFETFSKLCKMLPWICEEKHWEECLSSTMLWVGQQCFTALASPWHRPVKKLHSILRSWRWYRKLEWSRTSKSHPASFRLL